MVERALRKFLPQREVVRIPLAPGFFRVEFISINTRHRIFEKCDGIWTRLNETKIEASLQYGQKESILILNKWVLQAKTPGSIVPPTRAGRRSCGVQAQGRHEEIETREEKKKHFVILWKSFQNSR